MPSGVTGFSAFVLVTIRREERKSLGFAIFVPPPFC
jgi:hypothetical protein